MSMIWEKFAAIALCVAVSCGISLAQVLPATILEIDVENEVHYYMDVFDVSKFATDPNMTTPAPARNFRTVLRLSDIVAVNGRPAKGIFITTGQNIQLNTAPTPGQAIADAVVGYVLNQHFQFLQPDGTPIGSIMASGLGMGPAPPGAPSAGLSKGKGEAPCYS